MNTRTALIIRPLTTPEGQVSIRQRIADGYVCLTDICQAAGKLYADWRRQAALPFLGSVNYERTA